MSETKIVLSDKELEMVNNRDWILTKQRIIQVVYQLLESVVDDINIVVLPKWNTLSKLPTAPPRIFKGENYLGLPYVTLDYPKLFDSANTLTVRTMFWWGKFVSVTLHAGKMHNERLIERLKQQSLLVPDVYICVHEDQWHHYMEPDNYELLKNMTEQKLDELKNRDFIKIAYKINLTDFNELRPILFKHYQMLAEMMA